MSALTDSTTVLRNPHKGWYHHFYDNADWRYLGLAEDIMAFPGLDLIFIRLSWQHFEPRENEFDWHWIDSVKDIYVPKGLKIGIAITAKETRETYATPEWVSKAGAKGALVPYSNPTLINGMIYEPDFGDPVFLQKLDNFHKACAARYDGQKWLSFVQIASYGSWGEGHNWPVSNKDWPDNVRVKHIDIHKKHYVQTPLCLSDDIYNSAFNKSQLRNYAESKGIFWSDHSILVESYVRDFPKTFCMRAPELFTGTWQTRPTQLELEHYGKVKTANLWSVPDGAKTGASIVRGALALSHASWLGFHGDIKLWHSENPELAKELANKTGYWYFVRSAEIPDTIITGTPCTLAITWENRGVAPAYFAYSLAIKLQNGAAAKVINLGASGNRTWMPGIPVTSRYSFILPEAEQGNYDFKIKLMEENPDTQTVFLALQSSLKDQDGFYRVASATVRQGAIGVRSPRQAEKKLRPDGAIFYNSRSRSITVVFSSLPNQSGSENIRWTLFDLAGKLVKGSRVVRDKGGLQAQWDIGEVPAGLYTACAKCCGVVLKQTLHIY